MGSISITVGLPPDIKATIDAVQRLLRVNILSPNPDLKRIYDGYTFGVSKGFGILGQDKSLPQVVVVRKSGSHWYSPTCRTDSQCSSGNVCW